MPRTAKSRSGRKAKPATPAASAKVATQAAPATKPAPAARAKAATPSAPAAKPAPQPAPKRLSGLDAAAQVLRAAGEPLNVGTIMARIAAEGLWQTSGKTPAATIYAAMIREIAAKGPAARFQRVDRGRFAVAG